MFARTPAEVRGFVGVKTAVSLLALCLLVGCRASVSGSASATGDVSGNADASGDGESDDGLASGDGQSGAAVPETDDFASGAGSETALLGARHDLSLVVEQATNKCQCLAVGLGPAAAPPFSWKAGVPKLDPETQLVVALTSEGQNCEEPKGSLGASYWGYRIKGNDVFVFVESATSGRPLTPGGIIPKPFADGVVYVAPAGKKTPYGRGEQGAKECKLGNPGGERTRPVETQEQGNTDVSD
jgi:hypothetical protein